MIDKIKILPDAIANQIAAGEVIQRPASVVKELIENAIDADCETITINIKDAGKTLIQVIDDGSGMSETDARMAFERHSTSKISTTDDLFSIQTKGFRGEALASISSIAQVELKTKTNENDLGTHIIINGSEFVSQDDINCKTGCNFIVKNLFFNVPARRKFLKNDSTELKHIITEFQRVAIAHPDVAFELYHNQTIVYKLESSNLKQRLINIFAKSIGKQVIAINVNTNIIKIFGYIGKPELAKKKTGEQFFFVNNRFMKNFYFHKAITLAYNGLLQRGTKPSYFLFFEIAPDLIDINIHPTKTEINFEDANSIFQILMTSVKETLATHNVTPSIDFDTEGAVDMRLLDKNKIAKNPDIEFNPQYNPFDNENDAKSFVIPKNYSVNKPKTDNWEQIYDVIKNDTNKQENILQDDEPLNKNNFLNIKEKYIISPVKSGLMLIDQKRAHETILYEKFYTKIQNNFKTSQQTLYPININLNQTEALIFEKIADDLRDIGFNFEKINKTTYTIQGLPTFIENSSAKEVITKFIENTKYFDFDIKADIKKTLAIMLAKSSAINRNRKLDTAEMREIIDKLFACPSPNYTPEGKKIINIINYDEIDKLF